MQINDELRELIAKNLPSMAAGELKAYLEDAELTERSLREAQEKINEYEDRISNLKKALEEANRRLRGVEKREESCKVTEIAQRDRRIDQDQREALLELREKHADEKVTLVRSVVGDFTRNNIVRESAMTRTPVVVRPGYSDPNTGGWIPGDEIEQHEGQIETETEG